ncbi:pentatricopeptide repeat-containing protein At4g26680, mitochondrial [Ricinus communis]|uniref:pentatricopeptide repeat-containing protein At4g26680, mitochondrial n=1 Tax=Ricinus communis TaxID=3988 RepID=UPI00201AE480|nr:pentatricopeptide repeat-containing protein At4g26680, mitochondrial [Ricinus communis]
MRTFLSRQFSTLLDSISSNPASAKTLFPGTFGGKWNPIPIPNRTLPETKGQDLDFVNVAHSHLIHSDWKKLTSLSTHLTPFRVKHILLKIQKDHVLSLEFFNWVQTENPSSHTLETHSMILHILTKNRKFKSAELILKSVLVKGFIDLPDKLFEAILYSYRMCDSSPRVFDSLFKTLAHMKKFRNATDTFLQMKGYGFLPTVESCNAYLSSLLDLHRVDIALAFYKEMRRCRISPNVYTRNMVMRAFCKSGKLEKAVQVFEEMESVGISPNDTSYNTLIMGYCRKGLLNSAVKLKNSMRAKGVEANVVTFNSLIDGFCKEGKLHEASKVFSEMKVLNVAPNTITYNTLINGHSQMGNSEMGRRLYEEMSRNGVKADILTYNALILGLCKEGKTKKAAYMVKELDKENLVPNASTFSALISGQCIRNNSDRAFQLYKSMVRIGCHPNEQTFNMLVSAFCKNEDFEGAFLVLMEMFERCFTPGSDVLSEIYHGLCCCGKEHLAMKLSSELKARHMMTKGFEKAKPINAGAERDDKTSICT